MSGDDYAAFRGELLAAAGVLGRRVPEEVARAYFRALEDLELAAITRALRRLVHGAESGALLPTPVELRRRACVRPVPPRPPSPPMSPLLPYVTREEMAAALREVLPRIRPGSGFRTLLTDIASRPAPGRREPGEDG